MVEFCDVRRRRRTYMCRVLQGTSFENALVLKNEDNTSTQPPFFSNDALAKNENSLSDDFSYRFIFLVVSLRSFFRYGFQMATSTF